jgi:regulator of replication initiation timing
VIGGIRDKSSGRRIAGMNMSVSQQNPDQVNKQFFDMRDRLSNAVARGRAILLRQLNQMRKETLDEASKLRVEISKLSSLLQDPKYLDITAPPSEIVDLLKILFKDIKHLRSCVDEVVSIQLLLVEGHDIAGAANEVMKLSEVDYFQDMNKLEVQFERIDLVWNTILDIELSQKQLYASRLISCDIDHLLKQIQKAHKTYTSMTKLYGEETGPLSLLIQNLRTLEPQVHLLVFITCETLHIRHWQVLSEKVFMKCGLELKFAGQSADIITVIAMGNGNGESIADRFKGGFRQIRDSVPQAGLNLGLYD